ncbi:ribosomal protein L7/L12 [Clostridium psychrophilum]|uniref:ribosomal protein L7/L12 n=1 Tax=Clostridium psychrophilum TaxID=132926 RepID=UPI001C0B5EEA|nr:ribosomal protein L7/L12 [Clostridium psychrophilum]MBU3181893.1 ribosomal protein L7/L12 [Clostridium psychrophilum]
MNYAIILGLIVTGLLIGIEGSISQIRSDIKRINTNVNRIAQQVGVPDTVTDELKSLLLEGKKIKAIKKYREVTGFGLIEAKEYVDSLIELKSK